MPDWGDLRPDRGAVRLAAFVPLMPVRLRTTHAAQVVRRGFNLELEPSPADGPSTSLSLLEGKAVNRRRCDGIGSDAIGQLDSLINGRCLLHSAREVERGSRDH